MNRRSLLMTATATAIALSGPAPLAAQEEARPWMNPALSPDTRAELVAKAATPDELRQILVGSLLFFVPAKDRPVGVQSGSGFVPGIPRLGIPAMVETDASLGVANLGGVMRPGDVATAMPSGLAQAATFDPAIVRAGGAAIGAEARAKGFNVMLAGGVNLTREPRGGRSFEYLGEDPLLAGRLAGAQIAGVQSNGIVSTIKHFALNDQETGRTGYSVEMPAAAMRESDLLAFRIALMEGRPGSVMCAYNRVGGVYACENAMLLTDVLRKDWRWPGWVMSDWGAVHSAEALVAGLDQQSAARLDQQPWFAAPLTAKIESGAIPAAAVRTAALRVLRTLFAHGVVGVDWSKRTAIDFAAHAAVARRAADEGIVLLRNEGDVLPIAASVRRIVVIGGHADVGVLAGGGSSQVSPVGGPALAIVPPGATGMTAMVGKTIYDPSSPLAALEAALPGATIDFLDGRDAAAAAKAAGAADLAIVFATKESSEGKDAADLSLPDGQDALIAAVAAAARRSVVVLETGNPVTMPWRDRVGAILEAWYPGQKGGEAIADVLTGKVDPSGRLPITFPASADQLPNPVIAGSNDPAVAAAAAGGMSPAPLAAFPLRYAEGADVGYRWYLKRGTTPLYPFGHGLAYTRFRLGAPAVAMRDGGPVMTFTVTNSGARSGTDVPQVYVTVDGVRRLAGWARVTLAAGATQTVSVPLDRYAIARWSEARHAYLLAAGRYRIDVAESATDPGVGGEHALAAATLAP